MSATKVIAIFDIGKTNKKILLFDQDLKVVYQHEQKFETTVDEDGFECDDIKRITDWMIQVLSALVNEKKYDIKGVNFSTYGASLALINKEGELLAPVYNYLKEVDADIQKGLFDKHGGEAEFCRRTASPALGLLLNSGIQLLWLQREKSVVWEQVENILHFPQYLSYVLSGKVVSEPTSIGCHTFMWDFDKKQYHLWLQQAGIVLPEPVNNETVYDSTIQGHSFKTGIGIHDSSASLVPYLENSEKKFILVSTGTWCISMNPFNDEPLTGAQLKNDCPVSYTHLTLPTTPYV
jgi:sugar (pentulose or hexulose) kinase